MVSVQQRNLERPWEIHESSTEEAGLASEEELTSYITVELTMSPFVKDH